MNDIKQLIEWLQQMKPYMMLDHAKAGVIAKAAEALQHQRDHAVAAALQEQVSYWQADSAAAWDKWKERCEQVKLLRDTLKEGRKIVRASSQRNLAKEWDRRATTALAATEPPKGD